jgi:RNA polymerase sigma-70 factor (ECF subfamily)
MTPPNPTPGPGERGRLRLVRGEALEEHDAVTTFEACFKRYHRLVATLGLRILGRRGDVDDFVQDVFLEVHRGFGSLRDPGAAKAFVRAIAVRVAIKKLRRRKLAALVGLDEPVDLEPPSVAANQEQVALLAQVYRVLEGVPAKARVVWVLRHVEGEKLEDIAEATAMGLSSVKRHLAVASARLEEVLGE